MPSLARLQLGAPGIYRQREPLLRTLTGVRMDVCAFAGVAPRGPARVPVIDEFVGDSFWRGDRPCVEAQRPRRRTVAVAVDGFDDYTRVFGGFEGPGRLPYAVAAFFENGGRRAWVARIVHEYGAGDPANDAGVALATLGGLTQPAGLRARSEGSWANGMTAQLGFIARPIVLALAPGGELQAAPGIELPAGTLLRATLDGGARVFRSVSALVDVPAQDRPHTIRRAILDVPLPATLPTSPPRFEVIEGVLTLDDTRGRVERFERLGLALGHPRWIAQVLCDESSLAWPAPEWAQAALRPADVNLGVTPGVRFEGGVDRFRDLVHEDFFDDTWSPASDSPGAGICCFAQATELASLVVPDLYEPQALSAFEPVANVVSLAGATFERCMSVAAAAEQSVPQDDLPGLHLDPLLDLSRIAELQRRVIGFAAQTRELVALLDVPPGLDPARLRRWRDLMAQVDVSATGDVPPNVSSYGAAYHPWLQVARRDDARDKRVLVPPSAIAAGIVAAIEGAHGIAHGPANAIAAEVVQTLVVVPPALHDALHQSGINVYLSERDGIRLSAARTLSADPALRQLSVRRLMILLRRVLLQQMQWTVFEPNGPALWRELRLLLEAYLRDLYRGGAFKGANESEAFFVRCDASLNPQRERDNGRLFVEVGVAPAEPLEFIVLHIGRRGDGTLSISE